MTIRESRKEFRVTAAEAILLYMARQGLERSSVATRKTALAIETGRALSSARLDLPEGDLAVR